MSRQFAWWYVNRSCSTLLELRPVQTKSDQQLGRAKEYEAFQLFFGSIHGWNAVVVGNATVTCPKAHWNQGCTTCRVSYNLPTVRHTLSAIWPQLLHGAISIFRTPKRIKRPSHGFPAVLVILWYVPVRGQLLDLSFYADAEDLTFFCDFRIPFRLLLPHRDNILEKGVLLCLILLLCIPRSQSGLYLKEKLFDLGTLWHFNANNFFFAAIAVLVVRIVSWSQKYEQ